MKKKDIDRLADEVVDLHIADGPEYISIVEATQDEYEDATEKDWEAVAFKVRQKLAYIGTARQRGLI